MTINETWFSDKEVITLEHFEKALGSDGSHLALQILIKDIHLSLDDLKKNLFAKYGEFSIRALMGGDSLKGPMVVVFFRKHAPLYIFEDVMSFLTDFKYIKSFCVIHMSELVQIIEGINESKYMEKH